MVEMSAVYVGSLHCDIQHGPSKKKIETDAPKDNNGRGEAFSPTDLVGAALGSCILTTIAISAEREGIDIVGSKITVKKEMITAPHRRIGRFIVDLQMPKSLDENHRRKYEHIAETCPVSRSLHPDLKLELKFDYNI
jgi:putative redox protein